jgi:hypothetical protein
VSSLSDSIQSLRDKLSSLTSRKGGGDGGESAGAGGKFDPKAVVGWLKSNPISAVAVAVMLCVPVAAWWFASSIRDERVKAAESRAQEWANLEKLERTSIELTLPGRAPEQMSGVVTERTVTAYKSLATRLKSDA